MAIARQNAKEAGRFGALLGARSSVGSSDGFPLVRAGGVGLVAQEHGGALKAGGTPGNRGGVRAGLAPAERRRARAERSEAVDDAMVGHVEKMSEIIALVEEAGGEQYRCPQCGSFGPKVSDH